MYCKNCGKKLPDNARFCDRCNMSVRKKEDKMNLIEELKEERLARRKAKAIEERQKKIKKIRRKRRGMVLVIIGIILGLGVISGLFAYIDYVKNSTFSNSAEVTQTTEAPTESAAPAVVIGGDRNTDETSTPGETPDPAASEKESMYIETSLAGMSFAYPSSFEAVDNGKALITLSDGEAVITANKTVTGAEPKDLMKKYSDETGGTAVNSLANDSGYEITISVGGDICHKKSIVTNGAEIYYEFRYPAASPNAAGYESEIEYMDSFFND